MNVTDALSSLAKERGDAPAILTPEGALSFSELDRAVSATAKRFLGGGIGPGDSVAMALPDQVEQLVTSLALARLGAGQLVFHGSDTDPIRSDLAQRVPVVATVTGDPAQSVAGVPIVAPPPGAVSELAKLDDVTFAAAEDPDLTVFFQRSSGTTGRPKIGRVPHRLLPARIRPLETDRPDGRLISLTHIDFDGAKHNVYRFLLAGGCVAILNSPSVEKTIAFVRDNDIDFIAGSPVHATTLLKSHRGDELLFPHLAAFRMSSTMVPEELRTRIMTRLTPNLYVGYGITEVGIIAIAPPKLVRERPGVVGWVGEDIEAEILDADGKPLPPGSAGELRVRSPGMIEGYVDDPEETAKRFRDGWFYTGDSCEFADDGALIHHGRADDVIIVDGINIQPSAIEAVLSAEPSVSAAAAFGVDRPGHGKVPVAAVELAGETTRRELYDTVKEKMGLYAPWDIVIVDELPRNTAGKVMKGELVDAYARAAAARKKSARK